MQVLPHQPPESAATKNVLRWLWCVYIMICAMIVVGGTTRLTGSGLSMVEWRPLMGTLPPLSDAEWHRVFAIYKTSPQYEQVNGWMVLDDFKSIFFWEYLHRLMGRLIGLVYFLPMVFLWVKKDLRPHQRVRAIVALCLGGLQGLVGWYMVMSGLVDVPAVSHFRLATHLSLAFFLGLYILWWILDLTFGNERTRAVESSLIVFGVFVVGQVIYGAFMAGTRAGYMYATFPLLNGTFFPSGAWIQALGLGNLVNNLEFFNVIHRWLGIGLVIGGFALAWNKIRGETPVRRPAMAVLTLLVVQFGLGIATVWFRVPVVLGTLHQITAFLLLSSLLWLYHTQRREPNSLIQPPETSAQGVAN